MVAIVRFRDAVEVAIGYLAPFLDVPVLPRVPNPRVAEFVVVRRIGGVARDIVTDAPTLVFEAWAATDTAAQDLAQNVRGLMFAAPRVAGLGVYRVQEFAGPGFFPDLESNTPKYEWTASVALRGQPAVIDGEGD